jgi:hypothetical protein
MKASSEKPSFAVSKRRALQPVPASIRSIMIIRAHFDQNSDHSERKINHLIPGQKGLVA